MLHNNTNSNNNHNKFNKHLSVYHQEGKHKILSKDLNLMITEQLILT